MLYKSKVLTLETMVYSWYVDEYFYMGSSGRFYSCIRLLMLVGTGCTIGRAPHTRETLPNFSD